MYSSVEIDGVDMIEWARGHSFYPSKITAHLLTQSSHESNLVVLWQDPGSCPKGSNECKHHNSKQMVEINEIITTYLAADAALPA
jgi:hypothetical protein